MKKNYKTVLRDFIISTLPFYKAKMGKRILCFHDIQNQASFESRIKWLIQHFEIVSITELLQSKNKNLIALSFDDGYQSWITNVAPVLEKYNLPATFFVNSELIGLTGKIMENYFLEKCKRPSNGLQALTKDGLLKLAQNPLFEIGGHTKDHFLFSANTDENTIRDQVFEDKKQLEFLINKQLKYFAYPFGQQIHSPKNVQEQVKKAGYQNAFSIIPGFITSDQNPYCLHRDSLDLFQTDEVWFRWLHGAYDLLVHVKNKFYATLSIPYR